MKLVGGNLNYSSWTLRPWHLLTESKIAFEFERIPLSTPEFKHRIAQYSVHGRVPILIDDHRMVWESLAICEYINENHNGHLWPKDLDARAHARSAAAEMHAGFQALRSNLPVNVRAKRKIEIAQATMADIKRIESIWNQALDQFAHGGPWLYGSLSIADSMYFPVVSRFYTYGISLTGSARKYMETVVQSQTYKQLEKLAAAEVEVVEEDEAGTPR